MDTIAQSSSIDSPVRTISSALSIPSISPISIPSIEYDVRLSLFQSHPVYWANTRLKVHLWSKQQSILNSARDNRRTAVKSCHSAGKSFSAAILALWWLDSHKPGEAFVVTSAPTDRQVKAVLWREINRLHSKGGIAGRSNQKELWMTMPDGHEEIVAFGFKPADLDEAAFSGIHAKHVLVILDEGSGIHKNIFDQAEGLISNLNARIVVIGNPEDPLSQFAEVCKPGSGWNVIRISAFDTPNFTGEDVPDEIKESLVSPVWVEEKRKAWGESNPLYIAKILGEFPEISTDSLIPVSWVIAAQQRNLSPSLPIELGVDVGGGRDKNVIATRKGSWVRVTHRSQTSNTMTTLGHVLLTIKDEEATSAKVDYIGIGQGAVDRAEQISNDQTESNHTRETAKLVEGINVSRPASDREQFVNLRAEGYWNLRQRFERGDIDIDANDDDLVAQLIDIKWMPVNGRIQIESKKDMRKRGKSSPDDADAVMLAFLTVVDDEGEYSLSW